MWTYGWLTLIGGTFLATIIVAVVESSRRKKLLSERQTTEQPEAEERLVDDGFESMNDLDEIPAEPDFDFPKS